MLRHKVPLHGYAVHSTRLLSDRAAAEPSILIGQ
jgi:hypothetical protein